MRFKKCLLILFGLTLLTGCTKLDTFVMDVDLSNEYTEPKDEFTYVSAVSYANWTNNDAIIDKAINQTELQISSAYHLPIYKLDSMENLEQFVDDFDEILTLDNGYNEVPSFLEVTSEYDAKFFENNTLFVVYVSSTTGSERFDVKDVIIENSRLRVHVEQTNNPEIGTEDMAGWFMIVEIKDEHIADCEYFDAVFGMI